MAMMQTLADDGTGTVWCPPRGQREPVATCLDCQWLFHVTWDDAVATVRCAPPPPAHVATVGGTGELVRR